MSLLSNLSTRKRIVLGFIIFFALMFLPSLGYHFGLNVLHTNVNPPEGYRSFPALSAPEVPGFSPLFFGFCVFVILIIVALYLFPTWFGFEPVKSKPVTKPVEKKPYPIWFYLGIVLMVGSAYILFNQLPKPDIIAKYGYIPFMVGYAMIFDGIAYHLNGFSPMTNQKKTLIIATIISCFSWVIFAAFNFYVGVAWYSPFGKETSLLNYIIYFTVGASTLVPALISTWAVFANRPGFFNRYRYGKKIKLSLGIRMALMFLTIVLLFFTPMLGTFAFPMFLLGPTLTSVLVFSLLGIWTPFSEIAKSGNWSYFLISGFAELLLGFAYEGVNGMSTSIVNGVEHSTVPGFWKYSVPYVDAFDYGEMPAVGMSAYLLYGVYHYVIYAGIHNAVTNKDVAMLPEDLRTISENEND